MRMNSLLLRKYIPIYIHRKLRDKNRQGDSKIITYSKEINYTIWLLSGERVCQEPCLYHIFHSPEETMQNVVWQLPLKRQVIMHKKGL